MSTPIVLSFRLAAEQIVQRPDSRLVVLAPVHSSDPGDPNKTYSKYTPQAKFEFLVTNANVFEALEPGVIYNLVMVRDDSGATIEVVPPALPDAEPAGDPPALTGDVLPPIAPVADPAADAGVTGDGAPTPPVTPPAAPDPVDPPVTPPAAPVVDSAASTAATAATATDTATA